MNNKQKRSILIILGLLLFTVVGVYLLGSNQKSNLAKSQVTEIITQEYKTAYPQDFYIVNKDGNDVSIQKKGLEIPYPFVGIRYIDYALTQEMKLSDWFSRISTTQKQTPNNTSCKSEIDKLEVEIDNITKNAVYGGPFGNAYKDSTGECWYYMVQNVKQGTKTFDIYGNMETLEFSSEYEPLNSTKRKDILLKNGMHIIDFYLIGTERLGPNDTEHKAFKSLIDNFQFNH